MYEDWEAHPVCMKLRQLQVDWEAATSSNVRRRIAIRIHCTTWGVSFVKGAWEVAIDILKHIVIMKVL